MDTTFGEAFSLLGVGMVTVFFILWIVVIVGSSIIAFINRFFPQPTGILINKSAHPPTENGKIAAITAAVKIVTQGKGNITGIEKK
jgi:oxaloacetate decarboxylase (Na+ extruding) subunit gamma